MRKCIFVAVILIFISPSILADSGLVSIKSVHSVAKTLDRLASLLKKKGMTVFSRLDHAKNAKGVGVELAPTQLLIFGNPKIGSLLMKCAQTIAIDLPQKALAWKDKQGQVWLSYNNIEYLVARHKISGCEKVINNVTKALDNVAKKATNL